jgi:hypothetical protein
VVTCHRIDRSPPVATRAGSGSRTILRLSNDPRRRYIVNFSRKPIFGAGVGHHSPIGGYLKAEDLVFVLELSSQPPNR